MGVWGIWDGGVVDVRWNSEGRGLLWGLGERAVTFTWRMLFCLGSVVLELRCLQCFNFWTTRCAPSSVFASSAWLPLLCLRARKYIWTEPRHVPLELIRGPVDKSGTPPARYPRGQQKGGPCPFVNNASPTPHPNFCPFSSTSKTQRSEVICSQRRRQRTLSPTQT